MSQADVDAEFADLLGEGEDAECTYDAAMTVAGKTPPNDNTAATEAAINPAPATKELVIPATSGGSKKPSIIGKKRQQQLLVPSGVNKRSSLQVPQLSKASNGASTNEAANKPDSPKPKEPSPAPAAPEPSTAPAPALSAPASAASTPDKPKSPAPTTAMADQLPAAATTPAGNSSAADVEMPDVDAPQQPQQTAEEEGGDEEMQEADDEPEVQSPLKKARPSTNPDPSSQPVTDATEAKPLKQDDAAKAPAAAGSKRKVLTVAKTTAGSSTDPSKPDAPKPKAPKPAAKTKPKAAAGSTTEGNTSKAPAAAAEVVQKMPRAQTAFMFFSSEMRPTVRKEEPNQPITEVAKKLGEIWKGLNEEDKRAYKDMAEADKKRVDAEIAAMDPDVVAAIKQSTADARAAKKEKKAGKAGGKDDKENKAEPKAKESVNESKKETKAKGSKDAAKESKNAEKEAAKAEETAKKQAQKAEKAEAVKKEKAAFKIYHTNHFSKFKADNPGMEMAELNTVITQAWAALSQEEKDTYHKKAEEAAEAAAAVKAGQKSAARPAKSSRGTGRSTKKSGGSDGEQEDSEAEETEAASGRGGSRRRPANDDEDDESDREDVDWESHPASSVISHGTDCYLAARKGLMLTEYGTVDSRKAKARTLPGASSKDDSPELPVSAEQVEEYEESVRKFWAAVKGRMFKGQLDLEELEDGSPLEMCYLLGKLQEKGKCLDPNAKHPKGNIELMKRLPVMRLSMLVQRLVDVERKDKARLEAQCARLEDKNAHVKGVLQKMQQAIEAKPELLEDEDVAAAMQAAAELD